MAWHEYRQLARAAFKARDVKASRRAHGQQSRSPNDSRAFNYLGNAVLGGIDGIITTFAIVAGVEGAGLPAGVVVVLGLANIIADGFSMGVGNYLGEKADREFQASERARELWEIEKVPDLEAEEIRAIYAQKGFRPPLLDAIVAKITADRELWVSTMMREELGIIEESKTPVLAGVITFGSFILFGLIPLSMYVGSYLLNLHLEQFLFAGTCLATAVALFIVGVLRSYVTFTPMVRGGLEIVVLGGAAGALSYIVGYVLRALI